ncbi:hypothetical protein MYX75_07915 [Acidobacteria bacterium AH-259-A15]|nr:hypothetical protein [Acidobacteria bacterium AH-259-A15]
MNYWDDARLFINRSGLDYKKVGGQLALKHCPFCNDGRHKIQLAPDKPVFICHHCGEKGNFYQLATKLGLPVGHIVTPARQQGITFKAGDLVVYRGYKGEGPYTQAACQKHHPPHR